MNASEFLVQLSRQSLVVGDDQNRTIGPGDDVGDGEGLSRAGHPHQDLAGKAAFETFG
jgi:hypothetical protein